jgi:hypothetical protein
MNPNQIARSIIPLDLWECFCHVDSLLVQRGWHATSDFWRDSLERFFNRKVKRFVASVGRRGGKSSTMCRVIVTEILFGTFKIQPGDVGVFAIISIRMAEAEERLRTIADILNVLKVPHKATATEITIEGMPIVIRVYPASSRLAVGMTCIGILCDEVARWRDDETSQNPAKAILSSVRPSMASMPHSHEYLISSPWSTADQHYEHVQQGDTESQVVTQGPTWVANPTISEESTHDLEPDLPTWYREYGANPSPATEERFFSADLLASCIEHIELPRVSEPGDLVTVGSDWGFARNASATVVCHLTPFMVYHVAEILIGTPTAGNPLKPSEVCRDASEMMKRHGATVTYADVHYREACDEWLRMNGCHQAPAPLDVPSQYVRLRTLMAKGQFKMPPVQSLIRDLGDTKSIAKPGGGMRIILPKRAGGAHADAVSALALAVYQKTGPSAIPVPIGIKRSPEEVLMKQRIASRLDRARKGNMDWGGFGEGSGFNER